MLTQYPHNVLPNSIFLSFVLWYRRLQRMKNRIFIAYWVSRFFVLCPIFLPSDFLSISISSFARTFVFFLIFLGPIFVLRPITFIAVQKRVRCNPENNKKICFFIAAKEKSGNMPMLPPVRQKTSPDSPQNTHFYLWNFIRLQHLKNFSAIRIMCYWMGYLLRLI